jgi:small subunit ribosomal protein S20
MVARSLLESAAVANIKSQIKRNRQNESRRLRNKAVRTRVKTEAKAVRQAAAGGDAEAAEQLRDTSRLLDKAASKGAIHRKTAARRKSKLARSIRSGA